MTHPICAFVAQHQIEVSALATTLSLKDVRCGIYAIWRPSDAKHRVYVGQTTQYGKRRMQHRGSLRRGGHPSMHLQRAYTKDGEAAFVWALVESLDRCEHETLEDYGVRLTGAEQAWMDRMGTKRLFNAAPAAGSTRGMEVSAETRAKLSAAGMGRKQTPEVVEAIRQAHIGAKRSPETCARISAALTGIVRTPETRAAISAATKGRVMSEETKERMREYWADPAAREAASEKLRGRVFTPEHVANIKASLVGYRPSAEHMEALHAARAAPEFAARHLARHVGAKRSDETRAKMREAKMSRTPEQRAESSAKRAATRAAWTDEQRGAYTAKYVATRAANKAAKAAKQGPR